MKKRARSVHRLRRMGHNVLSVGGAIGLSVLACALLGGCAYYMQRYVNTGQMAAVESAVLVNLLNTDRANANLGTLTVNPVLNAAAQAKANDEAAKGYFAHISPDGKNSWYWFKQAGYSFIYAGENLAVNFTDSDAVEQAWMNSPTHRANILNAHFTQVGIATAVGTYKGRQAVFVVQMFGTPSPTPTGKVVSVSAPSSPREIAVAQARVLGVSASASAVAPAVPLAVASATDTPVFVRIAASPQTALRDSYIVLGLFIVLAMLFATGFEFKRHHMRHALIGLSLIGLLLVLYAGASVFVFVSPAVAPA